MLSILSCICWSSVCLLRRNVYLGILPIFLIGLFVFLMMVILTCVRWYLIEKSVDLHFSKGGAEHLFMCLSAICMFSWVQKGHSWNSITWDKGRLPRCLSGKESTCQCRRQRFDPWSWKDSLEEEMATHSSIFAWGIPWREDTNRLQSTCCKELDTTEQLSTACTS